MDTHSGNKLKYGTSPPDLLPPLLRLPPPAPGLPPTTTTLTSFLQSFFPQRTRDVPFHFHTPRSAGYDPALARTDRVILSVTATQGVYTSLNARTRLPPLVFLHRPWGLDRKRVRRGATVCACHVGFDEVLTVGWNVALAERLGVEVTNALCLRGYKGDPERCIGLVGRVAEGRSSAELVTAIEKEFGSSEGVFGFDGAFKEVKVVANMNAFHPEEVERVLVASQGKGWINDVDGGGQVLYLTGAVRELGLAAALEKKMGVVCVGHRTCEEWGIRYLASQLRLHFPSMKVEEFYEEEEPLPPRDPTARGLKRQRQSEGNVDDTRSEQPMANTRIDNGSA